MTSPSDPSERTAFSKDKSEGRNALLTLQVASLAGHPPVSPIEQVFGRDGGAIGRGEDNALVLPDPERYVSTRHALIFSREGEYFVTDLSANGVFLNDAEKPLGKGFTAKLQNGDRLAMGDYVLAVALRPPDATTPQPRQPTPEAPQTPAYNPEQSIGDPLQYLTQPPADEPQRAVIDPLSLIGGETLDGQPPSPRAPDGKPATWPDHRPGAEAFFEPPRAKPEAVPPDWDASLSLRGKTKPAAQTASPSGQGRPESAAEPVPGLEGAVALIFEAAGLDPARLPADEPQQILRLVGQVLDTMVAGFQRMLLARARLKSEFQMDATSVQPVDNNPLKFSVNSEQAIRRLFFPGEPGYLPARHAFVEAFEGMEDHELGMMTGLRAMFDVLLQRFDPAELETRASEGAGLWRLLYGGKGHLWDEYKVLYERMKRDADDEFHSLFREVFVQAYERQMRELAAARDKRTKS